jgi:hypothetical protein
MIIKFFEDYSADGQTFKKGQTYLVDDVKGATYLSLGICTEVIERKVKNIVTFTEADTITINDEIILADATDAAFAITLPNAAETKGMEFVVKKVDSGTNAVTLTADGGTVTLDAQYDVVVIVSNGTDFLIISSNIA